MERLAATAARCIERKAVPMDWTAAAYVATDACFPGIAAGHATILPVYCQGDRRSVDRSHRSVRAGEWQSSVVQQADSQAAEQPKEQRYRDSLQRQSEHGRQRQMPQGDQQPMHPQSELHQRDSFHLHQYSRDKRQVQEHRGQSVYYQHIQQGASQQWRQHAVPTHYDYLGLSQRQSCSRGHQHYPRKTAVGEALQVQQPFFLLGGTAAARKACRHKEMCSWRCTYLRPIHAPLPCRCHFPRQHILNIRNGDATNASVGTMGLQRPCRVVNARFRNANAVALVLANNLEVSPPALPVIPTPARDDALATTTPVPAAEASVVAAVRKALSVVPLSFLSIRARAGREECRPPQTPAKRNNTKTVSDSAGRAQADWNRAFFSCATAVTSVKPSSGGRQRYFTVFSRALAAATGGMRRHATGRAAAGDAPDRAVATEASPTILPAGGTAANASAPSTGATTGAAAVTGLQDYVSQAVRTYQSCSSLSSRETAADALQGCSVSSFRSRFDTAVAPGGWTCFTSSAGETSSRFGSMSSCFRRFSRLLLCCCGVSCCLYMWVYFSLWKPLRRQVGIPAAPEAALTKAEAEGASTSASSAETARGAQTASSPVRIAKTGAELLETAQSEKRDAATRTGSLADYQTIQVEQGAAAGSRCKESWPSTRISTSLVPLYACSLLQHVGPLLLPLLERSGVCWQALDELQDPLLPREARSACLLALQAMLQSRGVADALSSRRSSRSYSSAEDGNNKATTTSCRSASREAYSRSGETQTSLCRMMNVFVRPPPARVASTTTRLSSSDWLAALSCLLRLLDSTPTQETQVPYELLQMLVNSNNAFWRQRPSLEEVRALVLLKFLQNKNNSLAVYSREYPQLLRSAEDRPSVYASKTHTRLVLEYLLQQRQPVSTLSLHSKQQQREARGQTQTQSLLDRVKQRLLRQQPETVQKEEDEQPFSYRTPSKWLYQYWGIGRRLRAGETHDILRQAIRQINDAVEASAAAASAAASSIQSTGTGAAATATRPAAEESLSGKTREGRQCVRTHAAHEQLLSEQQEMQHDQKESLLPLLPVPDPLPRISPPLYLKQQLQEVELAAACTAAVVLLGLLTRRAVAGEALPVGNASDAKKVFVAFLRALRGLAVLEGVYRGEDIFVKESPAYYSDESFMLRTSAAMALSNGVVLASILRTHKYAIAPFLLLRMREMLALDPRL